MNSVISPPPPRSAAFADPALSGRETWLSRLSPHGFRLLVLLLLAIAGMLASQGMRRLAAMRYNYYLAIDRGGAMSPLAYGTPLPALNLAASGPGDVRAVVRADSAGEAVGELCALAHALRRDPGVVWLSATPAVDPCLRTQPGIRLVSATPAAKTEFARARWLLLDRNGIVLHSARTVPTARDVRDLAALLTPAAPPAAGR
jgi:hypothetical protein